MQFRHVANGKLSRDCPYRYKLRLISSTFHILGSATCEIVSNRLISRSASNFLAFNIYERSIGSCLIFIINVLYFFFIS